MFEPAVSVATAGPLVPPINNSPFASIAAAANVSVPLSCVIITDLSAKEVAFVPPDDTANVDDNPLALPVTVPSKFATKVPTAYPVPLVFTVVVGSVCKSLNNFHLPLSLASLNNPEYKSCEPDVSYNPYSPKSTLSEELLPLPTTTKGSSIVNVAVFTVVVLPDTVKLPATSTFPDISRLVASISPEALSVTPSPPATLNIIWSSVLNLI